jgi:chromate transporter
VVTFFTFLPSFVFILAGGPAIEATHGKLGFTAPLSAITAAVVGVILNLALWFAIHTLFKEVRLVSTPTGALDVPVLSSLDVTAFVLAVGALIAVLRFKAGVLPVLGVCAMLGAACTLL